MWAHGQQWAVVFGSLCSNALYLKRIFTSSENELTGEESKGGGWRSLNLQHIVCVSGCHGLNPPSRQVWQSEGLQEQRSLTTPQVPPHRSPARFSFPSKGLGLPRSPCRGAVFC